MSDNTNGVILALLAGIAIGAGIGVLLAPDKGENTRQRIKDTFGKSKEDWIEEYEKIVASLKHRTSDSVSDLHEVLEELLLKEGRSTESVIAALEKKLEQLKKQTVKS